MDLADPCESSKEAVVEFVRCKRRSLRFTQLVSEGKACVCVCVCVCKKTRKVTELDVQHARMPAIFDTRAEGCLPFKEHRENLRLH